MVNLTPALSATEASLAEAQNLLVTLSYMLSHVFLLNEERNLGTKVTAAPEDLEAHMVVSILKWPPGTVTGVRVSPEVTLAVSGRVPLTCTCPVPLHMTGWAVLNQKQSIAPRTRTAQ